MKRSAAAVAIAVTAGAVATTGTALAATGFNDVPDSSPFAEAVTYVRDSGITAGCLDGTVYCPGNPVTREQMAAFLYRASGNDPDVAPSVNASALDGFAVNRFALGTLEVLGGYVDGVGVAVCPGNSTFAGGGFQQDPGQTRTVLTSAGAVDPETGADVWVVVMADPTSGALAGSGTVQVTCTYYSDLFTSAASPQLSREDVLRIAEELQAR